MYSGMIFRGRILGARTATRDDNSTQHILGIGLQKSDGFGGTTEDVQHVKIPDDLVKGGVVNQVNTLIGKMCEVPVNVRAWAFNGKNGVSYTLSFESGILELKG